MNDVEHKTYTLTDMAIAIYGGVEDGEDVYNNETIKNRVRKTSKILRELCEASNIDLKMYQQSGNGTYNFSKSAFEIFKFMIKHYSVYTKFEIESSGKKRTEDAKQFATELYNFKQRVDSWNSSKPLDDPYEESIRQEFDKMSFEEFSGPYMLFTNLYHGPIDTQYTLLNKLMMDTLKGIQDEIESGMKKIFAATEPENVTWRAENYLKEVKDGATSFSKRYIGWIDK